MPVIIDMSPNAKFQSIIIIESVGILFVLYFKMSKKTDFLQF